MILLHGLLIVLDLWDVDHGDDLVLKKIKKLSRQEFNMMPAARPLVQKMRIDSLVHICCGNI
jgi:hypothetical protein